MPLSLDSAQVISETIDTLEINSFAVDIEASEIHIAYDEGIIVDGAFKPIVRDKMLSVAGQEFINAITAFETAAGVSKYSDLKNALYAQLIAVTGLTGTVS